jgi:hypothetical protein
MSDISIHGTARGASLSVGHARKGSWGGRAAPCAGVWLLLSLACTGVVGRNNDDNSSNDGGSGGRGGDDEPGGSGGEGVAACVSEDPGPAPLRRLTRFEYNNVVADLLGETGAPASAFPLEESQTGFDNTAESLRVSDILAEKYNDIAKAVASRATGNPQAVLGCMPTKSGDDGCVRDFITRFGLRAYRRPLLPDEGDRLYALYDKVRKEAPGEEVMRLVQAFLLAPQFMYRFEEAPSSGTRALGPYEVASRLSFSLWGSMPDGELFDAAQLGALATADEVEQQARRMLEHEKAERVVRHFHSSLLGLSAADNLQKSSTAFPAFRPELGPLFREETERFATDVVLRGDGTLKTLFTATHTFMNEKLAAFYGVSGVKGPDWTRVDNLDASQRSGFLTHASIMAIQSKEVHTEPIFRGVFIRSGLMCDPPPPPPPGIAPIMGEANLSGRERLEIHRSEASCRGCHRLFDGIGLAFENLDAVGQWRQNDHDKLVDASGEIYGTDVDGTFVGPVELTQRLARSTMVSECMLGKWFMYFHGRPLTTDESCLHKNLKKSFANSGHNVKELLLAFTRSPTFLTRGPAR